MSLRRVPRVLVAAALTAFAAGGCVRPTPSSLGPSGLPQADVPGATLKQVRDVLVASMVRNGYTVTATNEYAVTLERPMTGVANALMSSRFNGQATYRVTYTVAALPGGVRVVGQIGAVTNPGSGFEKVTDLTHGKAGKTLADFLGTLPTSFAEFSRNAASAAARP